MNYTGTLIMTSFKEVGTLVTFSFQTQLHFAALALLWTKESEGEAQGRDVLLVINGVPFH